MSLAEHMETLNAALMVMRDIKYRGEIEEVMFEVPYFKCMIRKIEEPV